MKQIVLCITKKPGMTSEEFKAHYENSHAPLAMKHLGHLYKSYQRNYCEYKTPTLDEIGNGVSKGTPLYDAITVITVEDDAAVEEFWRIASSPGIKEEFAEDEAKHLDRDKLLIHICDQVITPIP